MASASARAPGFVPGLVDPHGELRYLAPAPQVLVDLALEHGCRVTLTPWASRREVTVLVLSPARFADALVLALWRARFRLEPRSHEYDPAWCSAEAVVLRETPR